MDFEWLAEDDAARLTLLGPRTVNHPRCVPKVKNRLPADVCANIWPAVGVPIAAGSAIESARAAIQTKLRIEIARVQEDWSPASFPWD
jgi:hypothetical protein